MRIALISDIHGNLTALDAALADIARRGAKQIICLGDVAVYGPQPREVIARLRDLAIPTVMGNTDQWLLNPEPWSSNEEDKAQIEIEMWNAGLLSGSDQAAVAGYAPLLPLDYGGGFTLLAYHGSPRNFNDRVRPITPEEELDAWFPDNRARIMAGGHTHEAMIRRYGGGTLVNPGSVGQPSYQSANGRSVIPTWAEYALVEWDGGALAVTLLRVTYPLADLRAAVLASEMPHAEEWLADWRDADQLLRGDKQAES